MGFFDRFFGKKKEEAPRTPSPTYVPPEPPPLPVTSPSRFEPKEEAPPPPPVEQRNETQPPVTQPLTTQSVSAPPFPAPEAEIPVTHEATDIASPPDTFAEETEEDDFPIPEFTGRTADAQDTVLSQAEESQDVSATEIVGEVMVGVGTRLEITPSGTRGLDIADTTSTLDEALDAGDTDEPDFDIPMARQDGDEQSEASQLDGHSSLLTIDEEDDLEGFEDAFDRILAQGEIDELDEEAEPAVTTDQTEVRTLFSEIAANYIRPVKAFIIELRAGAARKEWLEMCQPAISSLGKSALGMGMDDVSDAVHDFETLLAEARASREGMVGGELRERILRNYQTLTEILPATFVIDDTTLQSEGMIVNSLLKQIPEVGKVTIDKLYRAGLITIESFLVGAKEDLAVATGLPIWLAEKIVEKFKSYQQQLESGLVQSGKDGLLNRLGQLVGDLQDAHEAYEIATAEESSNPSAIEDRRFYRQARQETQLQINVLLAELGAVELANEIQRLSFEKRIERLRHYIEDQRRS